MTRVLAEAERNINSVAEDHKKYEGTEQKFDFGLYFLFFICYNIGREDTNGSWNADVRTADFQTS